MSSNPGRWMLRCSGHYSEVEGEEDSVHNGMALHHHQTLWVTKKKRRIKLRGRGHRQTNRVKCLRSVCGRGENFGKWVFPNAGAARGVIELETKKFSSQLGSVLMVNLNRFLEFLESAESLKYQGWFGILGIPNWTCGASAWNKFCKRVECQNEGSFGLYSI